MYDEIDFPFSFDILSTAAFRNLSLVAPGLFISLILLFLWQWRSHSSPLGIPGLGECCWCSVCETGDSALSEHAAIMRA